MSEHSQNFDPTSGAKLPVPQRGANRVQRGTHREAYYEPRLAAEDSGSTVGNKLSPAFIWHVFRKRWKVAAPLGLLLASSLVMVAWLLFEPAYRSECWMLILNQRIPVIDSKLPYEGGGEFVQTQVELLRSPIVLNKVLSRKDVMEIDQLRQQMDPKAWLLERLKISRVGQSELYKLAIESPGPEDSVTILNAIVEAYFDVYQTQSDQQTQDLLKLLTTEHGRQISEVRELEDELRTLNRTLVGDAEAVAAEGTGQRIVDLYPQYSKLRNRVTEVELDRRRMETDVKMLDAMDGPESVPASLLEAELAANPELNRMKAELQALRNSLVTVKPESAFYAKWEKEIADLERRVAEVEGQLTQDLAKQKLDLVKRSRQVEIDKKKQELASLVAQEQTLREELGLERERIETKSGKRLDREFKLGELERSKEVAQKMADRIFWLQVEYLPTQRPPRVKLMQQAEVNRKPVEPFPFKKAGVLGFAGLFLPFGICVIWELFSQRVFGGHQITSEAKLLVIGEVSVLPARPALPLSRAMRRYERDRLIYEESVESLRTALTIGEDFHDVQALSISSAVSGEGKTSLAAQLAVSWARGGGEKVLIIDGDMRDPELHDLFNIERSPGLTEVLSNKVSLDKAIVHWEHNIDVLPAGLATENTHRLVSSGQFLSLIEALRDRYTRIVIDLPPILAAGETLQIAKQSDGVLLCVMRDVSRAPQVKLAQERLNQTGARVLGAVLNGTSVTGYAYRYGAYANNQS